MTVENTDSGPTAPIDVFREVVNSRRSVRKFDETPLPDDVIRDCLELAMRAPNSSNLQPWEFHVVRSQELRKSMVPACFKSKCGTYCPSDDRGGCTHRYMVQALP